MNDEQLKQALTVVGWAMWIRYTKKNSVVRQADGKWPEYDFNEFMKVCDLLEDPKEESAQLDLPLDYKLEGIPHG